MHTIKPLIHTEAGNKSDDDLRNEMREYFEQNKALQFQAGLWTKIRELIKASSETPLAWWSLAYMREIFPVSARFAALAQRPDIRQRIVTELVGIKPKTARGKFGDPEVQAKLVDGALDDGDVTLDEMEDSFAWPVWAVYIFGETFWREVRIATGKAMIDSGDREKEFIAFLIEASLKHGIITNLDLRSALDPVTWQKRIPVEKRAAVDRARIKHEHEGTLSEFTTGSEMEIVGFQTLVESFDSTDFVPVVDLVGQAMGFSIGDVRGDESPKA